MRDIGTLGGESCEANGINIHGQVVGQSTLPGREIRYRAFLWKDGITQDLGTLGGGDFSSAASINNEGQVVGRASISNNSYHAFYRGSTGRMSDLGTLGGRQSNATGLNDNELVVGWAQTSSSTWHACMWRNDRIYDLNNLIPNHSGWQLVRASAINNDGQIVGYGLHRGAIHAFLLKPVAVE